MKYIEMRHDSDWAADENDSIVSHTTPNIINTHRQFTQHTPNLIMPFVCDIVFLQ